MSTPSCRPDARPAFVNPKLVKQFTSYAIFIHSVQVAKDCVMPSYTRPNHPSDRSAPEGDVPVIWAMTREAPLAGHRVKPLNLGEHPQEATAQRIRKSMSDRSHFARATLSYAPSRARVPLSVTLR